MIDSATTFNQCAAELDGARTHLPRHSMSEFVRRWAAGSSVLVLVAFCGCDDGGDEPQGGAAGQGGAFDAEFIFVGDFEAPGDFLPSGSYPQFSTNVDNCKHDEKAAPT